VLLLEPLSFSFFLNGGSGSGRTPRIHSTLVTGTELGDAFSNLVLGDLLSKDKARLFTKTTLELKIEKRSSPLASLSPFAGVLEAGPPRSRGLLLGSPLLTTDSHRGPSVRCGERITSHRRELEHPWQCREMASVMEVERLPPCRQSIVEAKKASAMMSSKISPSQRRRIGSSRHLSSSPSPPRPAKRRRSTQELSVGR
jgi:hypothetical protein